MIAAPPQPIISINNDIMYCGATGWIYHFIFISKVWYFVSNPLVAYQKYTNLWEVGIFLVPPVGFEPTT